MTVTYILGLLLPLVIAFYLFIAVLEDSGFLPRLAVLADHGLRAIGLNGRAVIPLILGFGCVTMATISTRMLAGLGPVYWLAYVLVLSLVLVITGLALNRLLPGWTSPLIIELPPLRRRTLGNVLSKTSRRTWHFIKDVTPLFAIGAFVLSILAISGALRAIQQGLAPFTEAFLDLPGETATAFIMGFVRRDFGPPGSSI